MAELSHEETIRFENSKAHYHKIMGDVNDANKVIERLLAIKSDVELSISLLKIELSTLAQDKAEILRTHQEALDNTIAATQHRFDEVDALEANKAFIERTHKARVMELTNTTVSLEFEERKLKDSVASLQAGIKNATEELSDLEHAVEMAETELEMVDDALHDVHEDLAETTTLIDDTRATFHQEMTAKNKELESVKAQIAESLAKVDTPFRSLQEERENHAKRLKDYDIMFARMSRAYSDMYPGRTLKL